ncbi:MULTISPECIES: glycosyltransferase [unclassified Polaromonas]|jgi:alpha-1,3-rhamnosyltransferase|uniref:glycosyltransferase family 2 protein n=1 Tax=unclassified Polaromonas TaxID=2638319 RepID=UPI000BCEF761|nr:MULTISPECIES: glycosyltransferase [unclassified Polaromonas]OYZ76249.1 MAG: hypothetical protein B7Y09_21050 [Polaromonas sp. 24-63-21]OZA47468.1 MAG: hypothetical protein B7X88_21760 [Polaromonas sp. 17-63-33]
MIKESKRPLVSVIVPSYNHERYIQECIESIANQTYENIELIVIDDGSNDSSIRILKNLEKLYGFTLLLQDNKGLASTLNLGIKKMAHGEFIATCASDDYWMPDKIEKQIVFLLNNNQYPMCYGKTYYVDENSKILSKEDKSNNGLKGGWIFDDIFTFKLHPPVNYLFRKEIFDKIGLYDESLFAEDYDMNLRIASDYEIGFINEYIGYYRINGGKEKLALKECINDSHLKTIEKYKKNYKYLTAKNMVTLRRCLNYSASFRYKFRSIYYLFNSLRLINTKLFLSCLHKIIFKWQ